jgi:hypothetical protein
MNIPETLKMPFLSGFGKRSQGILRKNKVHMASLVFNLVFNTVFGMFLGHLVYLKSVK